MPYEAGQTNTADSVQTEKIDEDSSEFNQDSNLFAVGRVTQKIKFYD